MKDNTEFRRLKSAFTASPAVLDKLEQDVMRGIDRLPAKRRRRNILLALGSGILAAALLLVLAPPSAEVTQRRDYIESVVITEDHVFIWLEPVTTTPGPSHD